MRHKLVYISSGKEVQIDHQFGTVKRFLNAAARVEGDESFASLKLSDGGRVLVNPHDVSHVEEVKTGTDD
jgi:hypothetical protein